MSTWPEPGGTFEGRTTADIVDRLYKGTRSVQEYADFATLTTDGTTAIQQALDDAKVVAGVGHRVFFPSPPSGLPYMASNLTMFGYTMMEGELMGGTYLTRIPGSTGDFIREKSIAEGNPQGATGLWIRNILINCNHVVGDGIHLGDQVPGAQLNFLSGVENVNVRNSGARGFYLNQNAANCSYLWATNNDIGMELHGGASSYFGLYAEGSVQQNIIVASSDNSIFGVQTEGQGAALNDVEHVLLSGSRNAIFGCRCFFAGVNVTNIVRQTGTKNMILGGTFASNDAHTFVNGIFDDNSNIGTGTQNAVPLWIDDNSLSPSYFYTSFDGRTVNIGGSQLPAQASFLDTYSPSMTFDATRSYYHKIIVTDAVAMTINAPTGLVPGQGFTVDVRNTSGGAMGAITWDPIFHMAGAFTNPADTQRRTINFYADGSPVTKLIEMSRAAADIPI